MPLIIAAHERAFGHDGISSDHFQVEGWSQDFLGESKLHQGRFEQDASTHEFRQELGDIFAAYVDSRVARIAGFVAREDAECFAIFRRSLRLPVERDTRQKGDARFGIEDGDRQASSAHMDAKFEIETPV